MPGKPALMLPLGEKDYEVGRRMRFMDQVKSMLEPYGWTVGYELKGGKVLAESWAIDACTRVRGEGGRLTWHWPQSISRQLTLGVTDDAWMLAKIAQQLKVYGLEAVVLHCAPAVSIDPPEDMGKERYNSPIGAREMLAHIKAQVETLKKLNEICGEILIENLDITNFRGGGYRVPIYLALQTGSWSDLSWLAQEAGVRTVFDSEHYMGARNLLCRKGQFDLRELRSVTDEEIKDESVVELADITGYYLVKGQPPQACVDIKYTRRIQSLEPRLFHLGGSVRAVDEQGRIDTHLPTWEVKVLGWDMFSAREILDYQLAYVESHPECIGAVIEVTGQLDPEKYSTWSPRPKDDEVAKWQATLEVVDAIHNLKRP